MTAHPRHAVPARRHAFSLIELLVVVSIILVLMAMLGAGVSAARGSQRKQATQSLIARIDAVIQQQFSTYPSRSVPLAVLTGTNKSFQRAAYLRRLASAEMPDSWVDVRFLQDNPTSPGALTAAGRVYVSIWSGWPASKRLCPGDPGYPPPPSQLTPEQAAQFGRDIVSYMYADAECLFMIVMQGGIADCLDCGALGSSARGDVDGDGAFEFLDAWGNPIRYALWPAALQLPPGSGEQFFSATAPFTSGAVAPAKGGTMRPLVFSGGPDGTNAIRVNESGNLVISGSSTGMRCGDPTDSDVGGPDGAGSTDNITNLDAEANR